MKNLTRIFAGLALLGAAASCQLYEIDTQMTPEKAAASIRMECSAVDVYNLPAQSPDPISFNVSSNTPWTIILSSGADWLTVSPASSAASQLIADVVVTAKENAGDDRSATLTLKGENVSQTKVITIKQARAGKLFVTPMADEYSAAGGPLTFRIQTNVAWEIHSSASWLTFNRESGEPDPEGRSFAIIATAAPSNVLERTATVTVVAGDDEETFDVVQKGSFSVVEISSAFASAGESKSITIKTDLPWEVSADKDWITFDKTSGTGTGSAETIVATAAANDGAARKATVTVSAGGVDKTFEVSQSGLVFEIVAPSSTELPRLGGEMVIAVNSSLSWEPSTDVAGWEVEKIDATSFKVKAAFNNIFKPKVGKVVITAGSATAELELSQDINFKFEGNCEVQEDGSLKVSSGAKSRVTTLDQYRYMKMDIQFGDVNFGDSAELWAAVSAAGCNIYNQLSLTGNKRIRTDGSLPVSGTSTYKNTYFDITKDELNAMTSYSFYVEPNATTPGNQIVSFLYNGTEKAQQDCLSVFAADAAAAGSYWFGFYNETSDGTWYIVKSCGITPVED
ncbi:MAG: BACON domain-containing protein [Bacteroidales bacterium]|nr:BACON domain-containing protein [Bacteroidales bacterium]